MTNNMAHVMALGDRTATLYGAAADARLLPKALQQVTAAMHSDVTQLMVYDPLDERVLTSSASHESPHSANQDSMGYFGAIDPRCPVLTVLPSGSVMRCEDYFDERLDNRDGSSSCLAIVRMEGRPAFSDEDMTMAGFAKTQSARLDGPSAKQIAIRRGTSLATTRSQIAVVRDKAMCQSQRGLIARSLEAAKQARPEPACSSFEVSGYF